MSILLSEASELRRKKLISLFVCTTMIGIVVSITPDVSMGLWQNVLATLGTLPLFLVVFFLNRAKKTKIAALLYLFLLGILIFAFSCFVGVEGNLQLFFTFMILVVPFIIDTKNTKLIVINMLYPLVLLLILELTNYKMLPKFDNLTIEQSLLFGRVNMGILIFIMPFVVMAIIYSYADAEKELLNLAKRLQIQNQELSKINLELDQFAYSVSHDLRAPIASVLGLINISKNEKDLATLQEYNKLKEKSLIKLDLFIHDILEHSQNARLQVASEKINLQEFIEGILEQHQQSQKEKNIYTSIHIEQKIPFYSDTYRLGIIFNNLISNAIRYSDDRKNESFISIIGEITDQKAVIRVLDNGVGIEAAYLPKIFNMFYRASEVSKGSGLGLYILKQCVEKMQGSISVQSEYRKSTEFTLEIPNQQAPSKV